ncbi:hypothetical protein BHM03_00061463 [Ensete ventricosum]|nr:hypothetical protein BHM03_00061463 [Ensete ventricosum]
MGGAAIIVSLQQLKGLLGIVHFTTKMGFIPVMQSVFENRTELPAKLTTKSIVLLSEHNSGSFSRSAVNYNAGCKTALSNIVMASAVLFTMLFLMPLFYYTPNVMLSAIIIAAVIGLIDVRGAFLLWKVDKFDFLACMSAFFGVLLISVQMGLAIAVSILHSSTSKKK